MNLYLRLLWTVLRVKFMQPISMDEALVRTFKVLPNDLDINGHMNNGRYLTLLDLMIVEFFARTGFLKVLLKHGWRPMSGGAVITYRKGLKPFQTYQIRYSYAASNDIWNFMRFEFVTMEGDVCAAGYMKGAAVSKRGLVPNRVSYQKMEMQPDERPLPEAVKHWLASENAVVDEFKQAQAA